MGNVLLDRLASVIELFTAVGGIIAGIWMVIIKYSIYLSQNEISLTLMTHEERAKHRIFNVLEMMVVAFIFCFMLGIASRNFVENNDGDKNTSVCENAYEGSGSIENIQSEYEQRYIDDVDPSGSNDNCLYQIVSAIFVTIFLVAIISTYLIYRSERKKDAYVRLIKFQRFAMIFMLIFIQVLIVVCNVLASIAFSLELYFVVDILHSVVFAVLAMCLKDQLVDCSQGEVAQIKTFYGKRLIYLFGMKNDDFIAGDSSIYSNCECFKLIRKEELDEWLTKVKRDNIVYLLKESVSMEEIAPECRNEILRLIVAACRIKGIRLDVKCTLKVKGDGEKIEYSVNEGEINIIYRNQFNNREIIDDVVVL